MARSDTALVEERVQVPALPAHLPAIHAGLASFWRAVERTLPEPPEVDWRACFDTAVAEIGSNIVRHAYGGGAEGGNMRLRLRAYADLVEARFSDHGQSYDPDAPRTRARGDRALAGLEGLDGIDGLEGLDDVLALAEGGYGLSLARAAVDDVTYSRSDAGENVWKLVKKL